MTGLDKPTSGSIIFNGQDITKTPSYQIGRLGMARTFQVVKPLRQLTVRENVATGAMFGARGRDRSAAQARLAADAVLERVGLADMRDRTATELTILDLKRLELAKALAMDPQLLFLDEVMAGLNQSEIEKAMELIVSINRSGVTLFVIEHVMKAIMGISDRLVVLHYGREIAEGDPKDIVESPAVIEAYLGERFARRAELAGIEDALIEPGTFRKPPPAPVADPLLEIKDLSSGYGEVQILRDVSLEVKDREIVALIGANGAGKTTLLWTISRLLRPMGGSVRFAGRDITAARPEEIVGAGVVQVPQGRRLFAGLTVKENLLQGVYLRRDAEQIEQDLERVFTLLPRLRERAGQLAGRLSGGEQQMCAIGRGLMSRPRLLLIDELSLGLAPLVVQRLIEVVEELKARGQTMIIVEQSLNVAIALADRAIFMEKGQVRFSGPARSSGSSSLPSRTFSFPSLRDFTFTMPLHGIGQSPQLSFFVM